jgi:hypothetical protein
MTERMATTLANRLRDVPAWLGRLRIAWFNSYLAQLNRGTVAKALPQWGIDPGSSIWLTVC